MIILSIETSCDETAVSIVEATGDFPHASYRILGNALLSQIEIHREYGGVFPAVAKRAHAMTLVPLLEKTLTEAQLPSLTSLNNETAHTHRIFPDVRAHIESLLAREGDLAREVLALVERCNTPAIDLIAVTEGPGLEPTLWVGINFAKALAALWGVPVMGINHMEGHIFSSLFDGTRLAPLTFPAIALLISGGHTEIVLMREWGSYELIGKTRDDAVGEAFDKVARVLGLTYPGGPEISKRAAAHRKKGAGKRAAFPRPMISSGDCDFSFSGLKTAVLYYTRALTAGREITEEEREDISRAFEDAVTDVLLAKSTTALESFAARSLILGGGVSANTHIRTSFAQRLAADYPDTALHLPAPALTTDNAIMIALAAHAKIAAGTPETADLAANANLSVTTRRA